MEIIDLVEEYENTYCMCLEDWSDEMKEAGDYKKVWYERKKTKGLRVKLARNKEGRIVGMIQYVPVEEAPVLGGNLYYIYCIWIHGYKEGVGNWQNRGTGRKLLAAAEEDARSLRSKGMVAWGITLPFFMRSKWFKKNGYRKIDRDGITELLWKPFTGDAEPARLIKKKKTPGKQKNGVSVTCFRNGWCPAQNIVCERMKRAVEETGGRAEYIEIDTENRENLLEWGISDALYINGRQINTGPPPAYESLKKRLEKAIKKSGIQ